MHSLNGLVGLPASRIREHRHVAGADGLRGLACLIVLCVHAVSATSPSAQPYLQGTGKIGVWLFFVLSAYLLTTQLAARELSTPTLADYAVGRILRIYPLYFLALLTQLLFLAGPESWAEILSALALRRGFAHLWTIPVEFKFYLFLPVFVAALKAVRKHAGATGLFAATLVAILIHQSIWPFWEISGNSPELKWYLPVFLFGVVTALVRRPKKQFAGSFLGMTVLAVVAAANPYLLEEVLGIPAGPYLANKFLIYGLLFSILVWSVCGSDSLLARTLDRFPLGTIGAWSYSIYLEPFRVRWNRGIPKSGGS